MAKTASELILQILQVDGWTQNQIASTIRATSVQVYKWKRNKVNRVGRVFIANLEKLNLELGLEIGGEPELRPDEIDRITE